MIEIDTDNLTGEYLSVLVYESTVSIEIRTKDTAGRVTLESEIHLNKSQALLLSKILQEVHND